MKPYILLTIAAAAALVAFRLTDMDFWFGAAAKLTASTGFILAALKGRALQTGYGHAIVAGLAFSWMGDAFLLGPNDTWFTLGLISFLLGHILYSVAFLVFGVNLRHAAAGAVADQLGAPRSSAAARRPAAERRMIRASSQNASAPFGVTTSRSRRKRRLPGRPAGSNL